MPRRFEVAPSASSWQGLPSWPLGSQHSRPLACDLRGAKTRASACRCTASEKSPGRAGALGLYEELCADPPSEQPLVKQAQAAAFFEPEIDHFVMAITAAEATVRHTTLHRTA